MICHIGTISSICFLCGGQTTRFREEWLLLKRGTQLGRTKRIAFLLPMFDRGGGARTVICLANAFVKEGIKVDILTLCGEGAIRKVVSPQVRIIRLKSLGLLGHAPTSARALGDVLYFVQALSGIRSICSYIKAEEPQVFFAVWASNVALIAWKLSRSTSRMVLNAQVTLTPIWRSGSRLRRLVHSTVMKRLYPWADIIIAASSGVADDISKIRLYIILLIR